MTYARSKRESVASYHRFQENRDKSASAENARKRKEYEKNLGSHAERILGLEAVMKHLTQPRPEDVEPYFENRLPVKKPREQVCKDFFTCSIWDVEPLLLDELRAAQTARDEKRIDGIRQIIRAASWMKHERVDNKRAEEVTREKAELIMKDHSMRHTIMTEEGFEREAAKIDPDLVGIKNVIDAIDGYSAIGTDAEPAIRYVESALEQDWDRFLDLIKQEGAPWPDHPGVVLTGAIDDLYERIKAWRMIRDQLYFQRYQTNLSKIGQLHSPPRNPFSA